MQKEEHRIVIEYALGTHLNTRVAILNISNSGEYGLASLRPRMVTKLYVNFQMPDS